MQTDRHGEQAAGGVVTVGAEAVEALVAEVRRLREENGTLVRLNRLQGRFVAMASHEFKTPLTSITAYTDALMAHADDPQFDRGTQFLAVIRDETSRLLRMVNRILDFSRMEYGSRLLDRTTVDLGAHVAETVRTMEALAGSRRQTLAVRTAPGRLEAEIDGDLVRQVVVNIVGNALKYSPDGGRVTVTVAEAAGHVTVAVADNGPGIPPHEIRRIFREFYRADATTSGEAGTGLGLSIVRHIVSLHGGFVDVRSQADQGSVFVFGLPKLVRTPADEAPSPVAHPGVLKALTLLVAEHAEARSVVILLPADGGALRPAVWTGLDPAVRPAELVPAPHAGGSIDGMALAQDLGLSGRDAGPWLAVPMARGERGWLLVGRPVAAAADGACAGVQAEVLGRIAVQALRGGVDDPGRTVEALRLLLHIRRGGIPTATRTALDLATALAGALRLDAGETARLQDAAALHDAGMARVDDEILHGEGDLDWDARDEVDRHVQLGLDLLGPLLGDTATAALIRHHHERFDGSGHPDGLAGEGIPLGARALAVLDAWCSLTIERPFRGGLAPAAALREIERCAGTQFDPAVVRAFANLPAVAGAAATTRDEVPAGAAPEA